MGSAVTEQTIDGTFVVTRALNPEVTVHLAEVADPEHIGGALVSLNHHLNPGLILLLGAGTSLPGAEDDVVVPVGSVLLASKLYAFEVGTSGVRFAPSPVATPSAYSVEQVIRKLRRDGSAVDIHPVASGTVDVRSDHAPELLQLRAHYADAAALLQGVWVGAGVAQQYHLKVAVIVGITCALGEAPPTREVTPPAFMRLREVVEALLSRWRPASLSSAPSASLPVQATGRMTPADVHVDLRRWQEARDRLDEEQRAVLREGGARSPRLSAIKVEIRALDQKLHDGPQLMRGCLLQGRYELFESVARGSFGAVWRAWDEHDRTEVAVKVLHGHLAHDRSVRERFRRGVRHMRSVQHSHIIGVLNGPFEEHGFLYFIMEWVEGRFLDAVKLLPPRERLTRLLGIAEALHEAHRRRLIHRDVKPENILLADDGTRAVLCDFDLAHVEGTIAYTRTGVLGSLGYAAPEQLRDAASVGPAADQFGLGRVCMMALAGEAPPTSPSTSASIQFLRGAQGPVEIKRVIARATAEDPNERYPDLRCFADALREALNATMQSPMWPDPAFPRHSSAVNRLAEMSLEQQEEACRASDLPLEGLPARRVGARARAPAIMNAALRYGVNEMLLARLGELSVDNRPAAIISPLDAYRALCALNVEEFHAHCVRTSLNPRVGHIMESCPSWSGACQADVARYLVTEAVRAVALSAVAPAATLTLRPVDAFVVEVRLVMLALDLLAIYGLGGPAFRALRWAVDQRDLAEAREAIEICHAQVFTDRSVHPDAMGVLFRLDVLIQVFNQEHEERLREVDDQDRTRWLRALCMLDDDAFIALLNESGLRLVTATYWSVSRGVVADSLIQEAMWWEREDLLRKIDSLPSDRGVGAVEPLLEERLPRLWSRLSAPALVELRKALSVGGNLTWAARWRDILYATGLPWREIAETFACDPADLLGPWVGEAEGISQVLDAIEAHGTLPAIVASMPPLPVGSGA